MAQFREVQCVCVCVSTWKCVWIQISPHHTVENRSTLMVWPLIFFKRQMKKRTNTTEEKREQQGGCWEGKKGAVSCGWHPDRLVGVRNGFPEAPERSRHRHYGNATAWQTACSVSALTNACCQAGTCHSQTQTQTYTVSLTGPETQHIFCQKGPTWCCSES